MLHNFILNHWTSLIQWMEIVNSIPPTTNLHSIRSHSITDPLNVQFEAQLNDHSINSSSSAQESILIPSTSTDQTLTNTEIQKQPYPQQLVHIKHNQFDDEETDCDECVDGGIETIKHEDESDSVNWLEVDNIEIEDSHQHEKRPKLDTTQPNNAQAEVNQQCSRQPIDETLQNEDKRLDEEGDRMESEQNEAIGTQTAIEHYDHGQDNSGESMTIQQEEIDANNAIGDEIATESTANPIQPNLAQSNRKQCPQCPKSFDHRSGLKRHHRVHTGERPFACDQCGKRYTDKSTLTKHKLTHESIKRFLCGQCDKRFTLKATLDTHLLTHSGERPHQCRFCDKSFTQSNALKGHEQAKHLHIKPYRCKICGHTSTLQQSIITHIQMAHFGSPYTINEQNQLNIIDHRDPRELVEKV